MTGQTDTFPPERGPVERIAAEWMVRAQQGLTADEKRRLQAWLHRDRRHAALFAEMQATSKLLDQLRDPLLAGPRSVDADSALASASVVFAPRKHPFRFVPAVGAAAALALGLFLWRGDPGSAENFHQALSTQLGGWSNVQLPDGSNVQLNTETSVNVHYTNAERRVRLVRGEAFFTVAKNQSRPFWVEAGDVSVRAVGTAFNVRFRTDAIEVLVTEGKVQLEATALRHGDSADPTRPAARVIEEKPFLVAGQKARVPTAATPAEAKALIAIDRIDLPQIGRALAWQERRLEFADSPLADVVAEFNRYNAHKLVIADPALAARRFGGAFTPGGYEGFLEVLELSFGVVAEHQAHQTVLHLAP
jgi:transmembrane sensor